MLLVTVSVLQLREVVHPDLLAKAIRPQEPQPDLLGNLLQESGVTHAKRMLLSLGIYAILLSIHIWLPSSVLVRTGLGSILPFFQPHVNYPFLPKLQIPIELLVFHLSVLAVLEKYKNQIGNMQHYFILYICDKMDITDFIVPRAIEKFVLVGSRPLYEESAAINNVQNKGNDNIFFKEKVPKTGKVVDPFWRELSQKSNPSDEYIVDNINLVNASFPPKFEAGVTKRGGQRCLASSPSVISINKYSEENIRLSSTTGAYRLRRTRKDNKDLIEFWREIPGSTIPRPPDGWDDLGVGGAEVQGRWAWGNEKRSEIEEGVARRKQFKEAKQFCLLAFKLLFLLLLSWVAVFIVVCIALNTPIVLGRIVFHLLQVPDHYKHDPYGAVIGLVVLYLLSRLALNARFRGVFHYEGKVRRWISSYAPPASRSKVYTLFLTMVLWLVISPICLGIMYDMCFFMAHDRWTGEAALFSLKSCVRGWLSGFLILHVWAVMCYFGAFSRNFWQGIFMNGNDNNNDEDEVIVNEGTMQKWQGKDGRIYIFIDTLVNIFSKWEWEKVDSTLLLQNCMIPFVRELGLFFCISLFTFIAHSLMFPFISSSSVIGRIAPSLIDIGQYRRIVFRICALFVITTRLCFVSHTMVQLWFKAAHKAARDDRYLIGEELMNYTPEKK